MDYRHLGRSGFKVSELTYGNWVTHGSQIGDEAAEACVRAALEAGITSFDTADVYARGRAEEILGRASRASGVRASRSSPRSTARWPKGRTTSGLSRKHVSEAINASLRRLQLDYVDLYQAHRYDHETPLEETMLAFADVVRAGKALYIGVSSGGRSRSAPRRRSPTSSACRSISNQPQYSALYRVIEGEVIPASRDAGLSQIVFSPLAQGVLTGKYRPGQAPPQGSRATDEAGGAQLHPTAAARRRAGARPAAAPAGRRGRALDGLARACVGAAGGKRRLGHHRRVAPGADPGQRQGGRRPPRSRSSRQRSTSCSRPSPRPTRSSRKARTRGDRVPRHGRSRLRDPRRALLRLRERDGARRPAVRGLPVGGGSGVLPRRALPRVERHPERSDAPLGRDDRHRGRVPRVREQLERQHRRPRTAGS